jgi:TfoX/Sxy family transcriptional regulator of competence genes
MGGKAVVTAERSAKVTGKWRPAPPALEQQLARAVEGLAAIEVRKMFGYPAVFLNGNMFAGLFQESVFVRLSADDRRRFAGVAPFEPSPGRPMREYVVVPSSVVDSATQLRGWLERGWRFAESLPPKQAAKKTPKASGRAKPRRQT